MNKQQQEQFFDEFTSKMKQVMIGKGDDYAVQKDRLSNFKNVGVICGSGDDGRVACLHLIATKVARLNSLIGEGKKPSNESIDDSILDLANYSILLGMLQKDHFEFEKIIAAPIDQAHPITRVGTNPESSDV